MKSDTNHLMKKDSNQIFQNYKYLQSTIIAKQINDIVDNNITNGSYENIDNQLNILNLESTNSYQFMFQYISSHQLKFLLGLCTILIFVYIYLIYISIGTICYEPQLALYSQFTLAISCVFFIVDIYIIHKLNKMILYKKTMNEYEKVLQFKDIVCIDDLAFYSSQTKSSIIQELEYAIDHKILPEGHFNDCQTYFMLNDFVYNRYLQNKKNYEIYFSKEIANKEQMIKDTSEKHSISDISKQYIKEIHNLQVCVENKKMRNEIREAIRILEWISYEKDNQPIIVESLNMYLECYILSLKSLINEYVELEHSYKKDKRKFKNIIKNSLHSVIYSYRIVLEKLYNEYKFYCITEIEKHDMV